MITPRRRRAPRLAEVRVRARRLLLLTLIISGALTAGAGHARAQSGDVDRASRLADVEVLADAGRTEEARRALRAWYGSGASANEAELSKARLLRARLAADPDSAELDYVWVAIEGEAADAPEAWLRLAQLRLLRGEPERALADLERLRSSYPADVRASESWLWTGHAQEALGELDAACISWGRAESPDPGTRPAVAEALRACAGEGSLFSVQVGAFGSASGAGAVRRRLEEAGFTAFVATGGEDGLHRVRTGRFVHLGSAALFAERVRRRGFDAVVVTAARASG